MASPTKANIIPDEEYVRVYEETGSKKKTAEILSVNRYSVQARLKKLGIETLDETLNGLVQNKKPFIKDLPEKGQVFRYFITSAQNNTAVWKSMWENLLAFSEYYAAPILASQLTYNKSMYGPNSVKPGTKKRADDDDLWYDPLLDGHIENRRVQLAPGLIFVGDMNTIPTAVRPLSSLESFTGRASGIFPHPKVAMQSVASVGNESVKFNYTTGTVTKRNYIQKKAGQKAEFHHVYGALIVEVESDGSWWVRRLNADNQGRLYDLNLVADKGVVSEYVTEHGVEALTPGDIHAVEMDLVNKEVVWGKGGVVDYLRPKNQFLHDLLSFRARSHHEMKSFHAMMEKFAKGEDNVEDEILETVNVCNNVLSRPWMKSYVVDSNHDDHFWVWLDRFDYRNDLENAEFFLRCQLRIVQAMKAWDDKFNLLEWAMNECGLKKSANVHFIKSGDTMRTCKRFGGGVENSLHGDKAPNSGRGSLAAFVKMAIRIIIGHSHTAGTQDGVDQVGTSSLLRLPYNKKGPSSWSHTHCITYPNAKRTLFTVWKGKPWADR